jgi:hypothetical protein
MKQLINALGAGAVIILGILWAFGGVIGAIYWATQDHLVYVVLSLVIPLFGAASTIADLLFG